MSASTLKKKTTIAILYFLAFSGFCQTIDPPPYVSIGLAPVTTFPFGSQELDVFQPSAGVRISGEYGETSSLLFLRGDFEYDFI